MEVNKISGNLNNSDVTSKGKNANKNIDLNKNKPKKPEKNVATIPLHNLGQDTKLDDKTITNKNIKLQNNEENYDEKLNKLLNEVNEKFKIANREFHYDIHEKTNRYMVTVKDTESGDIIREIPSEESLDFFAKMLEMVGLLVDEKS